MESGQQHFDDDAFDYKELKEPIDSYKNTKYKLFESEQARQLTEWYEKQKQFYRNVRDRVNAMKLAGNDVTYK